MANDRGEAERPLTESGEGVSEGFEEAEADLIENATHGDGQADPLADAGDPEEHPDPAVHGEADHAESSETSDQADEEG